MATILGVLLVTTAATGCLRTGRGSPSNPESTGTSRSGATGGSGNCPPGHTWSDGQCHSTGKGHDPNHKGK